jgi:enediyne biosynthesis protein E4
LLILATSSLAAGAMQRGGNTTPVPSHPAFSDLARQRGLDFTHTNGASADKFFPEIMGSGGLFLDVDNDGWLDMFLVDGGSFADPAVARRARHRLFRNRGNGTFQDVTAASRIQHRDYGMGACAGDIDNDGLIDLYITNVGSNLLYRNTGKGRFTEVPKAGGATGGTWGTSCAFLDIDRDGYLDLFVTNYVDTQHAKNEFCGVSGPPPMRDYCHPLIYAPLANTLYLNTGRGTFEDISARAGIAGHKGNGLGVAVSDIDADGWPDVFVANDSMPNFLFHNERNGRFSEIAGLAGVAVAADGKARSGMGTAFADFAGTERPGLIVTNHETEMHSLFQNLGGNLFADVTVPSGVGPATRPYVGFGVVFFDYDNDARLDIAIVNGNVTANPGLVRAGAKFGQRNLLLRNTGGRFVDMKDAAGPGFSGELVSRTLAAGDIDNDGDVDLLITNNGGTANLLVNDASSARSTGRNNALVVRVIGSKSNRSALGTRLTLTVGPRRQQREVQSGSSYLGQNDLRAHFGLGEAASADRLEITWPGGAQQHFEDIAANQILTIEEGRGIVDRVPFAH